MFRAKTKSDVIIEALSDLSAKSSISLLSPGSKARALIESVGQVIGTISEDTSDGILQTLLTEATGPSLDLIAGAYGIQRLPAVPPKIESEDESLRYYVRAGTFGDINNGNQIVVPTGTQIRANAQATSVVYLQRQAITLPANQSQVYVAADEFSTRVNSNVSPGTLTAHNFTGYTDSAFKSLLVTNDKGAAGRPRENDSNLRYRVRSVFTGSAGANLTAIRLAALQAPGVSDVRVLVNRAGLGTFDVVVFGISPTVGASLLRAVQDNINRVSAVGSRGIAVQANLIGVSLRARVRFRANTPQGEKNQALVAADANVRRYVNDLQPGQELTINVLTSTIFNSSDAILDIGLPGDPFEELLIWRQTSPTASRFSRNLEANRQIRSDEDLVIEPYVEQPILLFEAI